MKPEKILWLEQQIGFNLKEQRWQPSLFIQRRHYLLNYDKEIIGINIGGSQISDISVLSELKNLTYLHLNRNQISDISSLSELKKLTSLHIDSNQISDIFLLETLKSLTSLYLTNNQISDISSLSELKNLTTLNLSNNQISDISSLSELKNLTTLNLSNNQISDVSSLSELKNLTTLNLSDNQILTVSFSSKMESLTELQLTSNFISDTSFLSKLKHLTSLSLNHNSITNISFLSDLKNLTDLTLSFNSITKIYQIKEIIKIKQLRHLELRGNPITYLPKELLGKNQFDNCLQDLRNYFQNQDFVPNKEIKVVILGNGMVGKSTLLNRFLNPTGDWEKEIQIDISDRTEGIVIKENIPFDLEDDKEIRLNIWDFGGQEVYHGTHRLFLNKDAVYIIVWTLETDEQKEEIRQDLNYWLDYAQDLAIDSPIILVHSQCDKESEKNRKEINKQLDISELPKYEGNIIENDLSFSAKTGEGLNQLNEAIKKAIKDKLSARVETKIPEKWSDLRDDLRKLRENEEDKQNEISKEDYLKECANYEIKESEAETVLTFLHRTGFLYYDEKLSKNIILNQTWTIEAIYEALKPKSIAKRAKGKLEYEDLESFWLDKNYSKTEVETFIDFMVSSEICFCKEQQNYRELENPTFIVPHYLEEPSRFVTKWEKDNSFYMIYKPAFFHKGIAERFLSRLGRLSGENELWKDGIRIFSNTFNGDALIIFDREKKEVNISTDKFELLEAVINELNKILDEGSQTQPSEKVTFFYSLDGEEFVEKEDLLKGKELNSDFVFTTEKNKVELKPFLEKYRFDSTQKTVLKESNFEKDEKQNETLLMKEANNKVIPAENSDTSQNRRIQRKINITEKAILVLNEEIEKLENVIDNSKDFVEVERVSQELENLENKLEEAQKTLEELKQGNFIATTSVHSSINKSLKYLEEANYASYFEEMDKIIIPNSMQFTYNELKGKFTAGVIPHNFNQLLSTFAREVNKNLI